MARVPYKPENEYPLFVRFFFWLQKRKYQIILEPTFLWGRSPKLLYGFQALAGAVARKSSPIEPVLRTLITVRVSQINSCPFCVDIHSSILMKLGVPMEKILALGDCESDPSFTERERSALAYAVAMTRYDMQVDDTLFGRVRAQFGEDEIVELTAIIGIQNLSSKFNSALGVPAQGFCLLPGSRKNE